LDLTDGGNRDSKLAELWESYRQWCEHGGSLAEKYLTPSLFLKMLGGALNGLLTPMKSMFHFFWNCANVIYTRSPGQGIATII